MELFPLDSFLFYFLPCFILVASTTSNNYTPQNTIKYIISWQPSKCNSPAKVTGKFSLRLVPHQDPQKIETQVTQHLQNVFSTLNSPNKLTVSLLHGAKAWLSDPKHPNFEAAAKATRKVYGRDPDYTREGGSIPITTALEEATNMNVCLLPVGACDDMAHSQNEKYNVSNLINGVKVRQKIMRLNSLLLVLRPLFHCIIDLASPHCCRCRSLDCTCTNSES